MAGSPLIPNDTAQWQLSVAFDLTCGDRRGGGGSCWGNLRVVQRSARLCSLPKLTVYGAICPQNPHDIDDICEFRLFLGYCEG